MSQPIAVVLEEARAEHADAAAGLGAVGGLLLDRQRIGVVRPRDDAV
jgi:hypothetical protein